MTLPEGVFGTRGHELDLAGILVGGNVCLDVVLDLPGQARARSIEVPWRIAAAVSGMPPVIPWFCTPVGIFEDCTAASPLLGADPGLAILVAIGPVDDRNVLAGCNHFVEGFVEFRFVRVAEFPVMGQLDD